MIVKRLPACASVVVLVGLLTGFAGPANAAVEPVRAATGSEKPATDAVVESAPRLELPEAPVEPPEEPAPYTPREQPVDVGPQTTAPTSIRSPNGMIVVPPGATPAALETVRLLSGASPPVLSSPAAANPPAALGTLVARGTASTQPAEVGTSRHSGLSSGPKRRRAVARPPGRPERGALRVSNLAKGDAPGEFRVREGAPLLQEDQFGSRKVLRTLQKGATVYEVLLVGDQAIVEFYP